VSDIFREVDEELRQDRLTALWKKYGNFVLGGAVLIVAATAGVTVWKGQQHKARESSGEAYVSAAAFLAEQKTDEAAQALAKLATDGSSGYAALARLQLAALKTQAGDTAGAVAAYEEMAADSALDGGMRDLATVLAVMHGLDTMEPDAAAKRLETIAKEGNPWRHMAKELQAVIALKKGDTARAKELYTALADDAASPPALRGRATEMLATLGG
jgi:hypothetical protein